MCKYARNVLCEYPHLNCKVCPKRPLETEELKRAEDMPKFKDDGIHPYFSLTDPKGDFAVEVGIKGTF